MSSQEEAVLDPEYILTTGEKEGNLLTVRNVSAVSSDLLLYSNENIVHLVIDYNDIASLTNELCERFQALESLSAKGNRLKNLPENIGKLKVLKKLHLPENEISVLPDSICELKSLESLYLLGNNLRSLPTDFGSLTALQELYLSENKLQTLPDSLCSLTKLEKLDCSFNILHSLPVEFGSLISLENLNLCKNLIVDLPVSFSKLPSLQELDMADNSIKELPPTFESHVKIIKLLLDNNHIISLPPWFSEMCEIKVISLNNNPLKGKPFNESFGKSCKKLEQFALSGCFIEELPESLSECSQLEFFDVGSSLFEPERRRDLRNGNHIDRLPSKFGSSFSRLKELFLDECQIRELPDCFGTSLSNLRQLVLFMNDLQSLPNSFCEMSQLRICVLSHNYLLSLPDNFGKLKSLVELRIDSNQLSSLPSSFGELDNLTTLDLYDNKFTLFPSILRQLPLINCLSVGLPLSSMAVNMKAEVSDEEKNKLEAALRAAAHGWNRDECHSPVYMNSGSVTVSQINVFPERHADDTWDEDTYDGTLPAVQQKSRHLPSPISRSRKRSKFRRKRLRKAIKSSDINETQFEDAQGSLV